MKSKFYKSVAKHQSAFEIDLSEETIRALENFYEGVMKNNNLLHLVGRCDAEEFAIRHILESLYAMQYLPENSFFADIGSGAGLPGIPCLIARKDLKGLLIESKQKKTEFLEKAVTMCDLENRAAVENNQFDEAEDRGVSHVFCRAIDGFSKKMPRLLKWSKTADLIFFAGNNVRKALEKNKVEFSEKLIPMSERRFIFHIKREEPKIEEPIQTEPVEAPVTLDQDNLLEL